MDSFFVRYRNIFVLLVVLFAQIIGLAVQVRRSVAAPWGMDTPDGAGVRLIRLWAEAIVSPPERMVHNSKMGLIWLWNSYMDLHRVSQENTDLQKTVDRLRLEQASLMEDAREGQRLQAILGFQEKYLYKTVAAQAIGSSGSDQSRVFYIDKGSDAGLQVDMAVITADGIVGKIREVFPHTAQVLMINDQTSGAGVMLESTRIRGILRGNASGRAVVMGILADQRIQPGEKVLTAGGDQIFPRGLPVGVVEKVVPDPDRDSFIHVIVKPAAHIDRLDEVLVITSLQTRFSDAQQKDMAESEAEKGAEVDAMKAQQKAAQQMAERLPGLTDLNPPKPKEQTDGDKAPTPAPLPPDPPHHSPGALHPDRFTPSAAGALTATKPTSAPTDSAAKLPAAKKTTVKPATPQRRIP